MHTQTMAAGAGVQWCKVHPIKTHGGANISYFTPKFGCVKYQLLLVDCLTNLMWKYTVMSHGDIYPPILKQ